MGSLIVNKIEKNRDNIYKIWMKEMHDAQLEEESKVAPEYISKTTNETFINSIFGFLFDSYSSKGKLNEFINRVLKYGWRLSYITTGIQLFRRIIISEMMESDTKDHILMQTIYKGIDELIDPIFTQLIQDATKSWESTVTIQRQALLELSAPLIPIMERICVMPLIGTIDTERAKRIMENLLQGVINNKAEVVLIDITGVPIVDTMVAHHIIQASDAVRLVGSECILVGIRPEIAQTIVNLGIDLGEFPTKSTLQKGMETALELTKRKIVNLT